MTMNEKISSALEAYKKTIQHLSSAEQNRRIKRREKSLAQDAWNDHLSEARAAGVAVGFHLND